MVSVAIGEGIHRGPEYTISINLDSDKCDKDWIVSVTYNTIPNASCSETRKILCGQVNAFKFQNTGTSCSAQ